MPIAFHPLPSRDVDAIRRSGEDAYGAPVEWHVAREEVRPCRYCFGAIQPGEEYLILAYRPFRSAGAYAETGPIFLCAKRCARAPVSDQVPAILRSPRYLVRGYSASERIVYGTGEVVARGDIAPYAQTLLDRAEIAFVDVRSAANNCYQCRIRRATEAADGG
ncbi:MAG: DUF1203 domain-containing protein [Pseudomonadota bacterium]